MVIFIMLPKKPRVSESTIPLSEAPTLNLAGLDINLLLQEIRQLRIQLERTIENNNLLRNRLEEQLARSPPSTQVNVHHMYHGSQHTGKDHRWIFVW